jgi:hypothetical protein
MILGISTVCNLHNFNIMGNFSASPQTDTTDSQFGDKSCFKDLNPTGERADCASPDA